MGSTRREFFERCLAATGGGFVLSLSGCSGDGRSKNSGHRGARGPENGEQNQAAPSPREEPIPFEPAYLALERSNELARREETLWEFFRACRLCPRACEVNRMEGQTGSCGSTSKLKIASYGPHFGEEPPLVGSRGSGTIFFSNCNLLCIFCQNYTINHQGEGRFHSHNELAEMMLDLQGRGCHNINLVTPTHVVPHIIKALRIAIKAGLRLPLVYNTGGYDSLEVIKLLDGIIDIYLPDFKYQDSVVAHRLSSGAADYPEVAAKVLREMLRQTGLLRRENGIVQRGIMVRHLVMPNNLAGTDRFVQFVARELGPETYVNIMGQYRPLFRAAEFEEISRRVTAKEMTQALRWAKEAGLRGIET